jgi:hypothetical protein
MTLSTKLAKPSFLFIQDSLREYQVKMLKPQCLRCCDYCDVKETSMTAFWPQKTETLLPTKCQFFTLEGMHMPLSIKGRQ